MVENGEKIFVGESKINYFKKSLGDKKTKEYNREYEGLLSPILAEFIIDKKIDLKELIMTTIIELNVRGNIEIIDNDKVKLIHYEGLDDYEIDIVDLIFRKNDQIKFGEINDIFIYYNNEMPDFQKRMKKICKEIKQKLYNEKIINIKWNKIFNLLREILKIVLINLSLSIIVPLNTVTSIVYIFLNIIIFSELKKEPCIILVKYVLLHVLIICIISIVCISGKSNFYYGFVNTILTEWVKIFILFIGIILYKKYKKDIYTEKGTEEYLKLIRLKNYLIEYSIIKERDLEETVIWDRYLAYATAFGMPNKITRKIYESVYKISKKLIITDLLF